MENLPSITELFMSYVDMTYEDRSLRERFEAASDLWKAEKKTLPPYSSFESFKTSYYYHLKK